MIVFGCDLLVRSVVKRHGIWVMVALLAFATFLLFFFLFKVDILVLIKHVLLLGIEGFCSFLSLLGLFFSLSLKLLFFQGALFLFLALALHLDLILGLLLLAVVHQIELRVLKHLIQVGQTTLSHAAHLVVGLIRQLLHLFARS